MKDWIDSDDLRQVAVLGLGTGAGDVIAYAAAATTCRWRADLLRAAVD